MCIEVEFPDAETRQDMVDERACRILESLPPRDESMAEGVLLAHYLADEWACLEVAAVVVAPLYGLDPTRPAVVERLQQAAHAALKAECERFAGEGEVSSSGTAP